MGDFQGVASVTSLSTTSPNGPDFVVDPRWERPDDEAEKSPASRLKTKIVRSAMVQGVCGVIMLIVAIMSESYLGWSYRYNDTTTTGGRLIDLQYFYSILTVILGAGGFYLWTRFWFLVNTDQGALMRALKLYIVLYACSWGLALWTVCTVFLEFEPISELIANEATDTHAYVITAIVVLLFYLAAAFNYGAGLFLYTHQLGELRVVKGTVRMLDDSLGTSMQGQSSAGDQSTMPQATAPGMHGTMRAPVMRAAAGGSYEALDPRQFEELWMSLPTAAQFSSQVSRVPSREELVAHLSRRGFQVVAAGVADDRLRVLFSARRDMVGPSGRAIFLAEFDFDMLHSSLMTVVKCTHAAIVPEMIQAFELGELMDMLAP